MDQRFSRYAIASISLALLVPVEFYANIRGFTRNLPPTFVVVIMIAEPIGAIALGHLARRQVRRSGFIRGGYGTGSTGMILGYIILSVFAYLYWMVSVTP